MPLSNPSVSGALSGSYSGNGNVARQISCGFIPKYVVINGLRQASPCIWFVFPLKSYAIVGTAVVTTTTDTPEVHLHATDGFVVGGVNADIGNVNAGSYFYVAFK